MRMLQTRREFYEFNEFLANYANFTNFFAISKINYFYPPKLREIKKICLNEENSEKNSKIRFCCIIFIVYQH